MNQELRFDRSASGGRQGSSPGEPRWTKAIAPARDRAQSRILTLALGGTLALASVASLALRSSGADGAFPLAAILVSAGFALAVVLLRAATPGGAASGASVCLLLMLWTRGPDPSRAPSAVFHTGLTPLLLLFVCTFLATRAGKAVKASRGLAESSHGRRASQVLANLAAAALFASACGLLRALRPTMAGGSLSSPEVLAAVLALGALAEAAADTVSSEVGQAFGGQPRMLLTLELVPAGTDGALTALGTAAGIAAALVIAIGGGWAMHVGFTGTAAAFGGGVVGLFVDSLFGATLERRGFFGNDLVNFCSTAIAAISAAACAGLLARL